MTSAGERVREMIREDREKRGHQRTHEHEYVLGFVFLEADVYLIRKLKPEWQRGRLNGIGGKLEGDEEPVKAMRREFREETGTDIPEASWRRFGCLDTIHPGVARIWLFSAALDTEATCDLPEPTTQEEEEVVAVSFLALREIPEEQIHDNVKWMLALALAEVPVMAEIQEVEGTGS